MRVPISWLKEYVEIPLPVQELAERLTFAGLEVASVECIGLPESALPWDPDRIVVGEIVGVSRHPNADRLILDTVEYGAAQPKTLVTGAPNLQVGDLGLGAAHDPGDGDGTRAIRDQEPLRREDPRDPVQRRDRLADASRANRDA